MPCSTSSTRRFPPAVDSAHSRSCSDRDLRRVSCAASCGSPLFFVGRERAGRRVDVGKADRPALARRGRRASRTMFASWSPEPAIARSVPTAVLPAVRRPGRVGTVTCAPCVGPGRRLGSRCRRRRRHTRSTRVATAGGPDPTLAPGTDYAFLLDDGDEPVPDPASRWQPDGVHGPSRVYDQDAYAWSDRDWAGRDLPGAVIYELHVGTFTAGRHVRLRDRAARPPRRPRHHPRRGAADQRSQRHVELGLRRRRLVRGARAARRPGRLQAVRRRRARARPGRRARRRLQPPRPVRELPAPLRPVPEDRTQHLGRSGQRRGTRGPRASSSTTR